MLTFKTNIMKSKYKTFENSFPTMILYIFLFSTIFLPYGTGAYKIIGVTLTLLTATYLSQQRYLSLLTTIRKNKIILILLVTLIFLSFIKFIPSSTGTILIFIFLILVPKEIFYTTSQRKFHIFLIISYLYILLLSLNMKHGNISFLPQSVNSNYIALQSYLLFICSIKSRFKFGYILTISLCYILSVRSLELAVILYFITIPLKHYFKITFFKNILIFIVSILTLVIVGLYASNIEVPVLKFDRPTLNLEVSQQTLDRFSTNRIKLNNNFIKEIVKNPKSLLLGKGKGYKGTKIYNNLEPVHNSTLSTIAKHGVLYTFLFILFLFVYLKKFGQNKDMLIFFTYTIFGHLLHGLYETFPIIILLSLIRTRFNNLKLKQ